MIEENETMRRVIYAWSDQAFIYSKFSVYKEKASVIIVFAVNCYSLLWPPCVADVDIIFLPCGFLFFLFFLSSPNLSGRRVDVSHTSTHNGVALVRIWNACLKCAPRGSLEIQHAK